MACLSEITIDFGKAVMEIPETRAPQKQSILQQPAAVTGPKPVPNFANEWRLELWIHY
jgi:hypothetical protein